MSVPEFLFSPLPHVDRFTLQEGVFKLAVSKCNEHSGSVDLAQEGTGTVPFSPKGKLLLNRAGLVGKTALSDSDSRAQQWSSPFSGK